jgi:MFS transporter, Spinster family, sphingosine-1-phosphate transporter
MKNSKYPWFVFGTFMAFMLFQQAEKLVIGPLTTPIMDEFKINEAQMGLVFTGALVVGAILYPVWGYLYDRFARTKLLALAALLWGATTWLSASVRVFPLFVVARSSTGIADSSYPGLYNVTSDYFAPSIRGKVMGFLQIAQPFGYLIGMVIALLLSGVIGWRGIFYITGAMGFVLAVVIFFWVKEPQRGSTEPELEGVDQKGKYKFNWPTAAALFKKRSLIFIYLNCFAGVFPWQVLTFWFFRYLETERGYNSTEVLVTMVIAVVVLAAGYPVGGILGDRAFKRFKRGRLIVSAIGVIVALVFLVIAINLPNSEKILFGLLLACCCIFMPFASPNVVTTIYDMTLPEVRSTANAIQNFFEQVGSSTAPLIAGLIAMAASLQGAILYICISAWLLCFVFLLIAAYLVPKDLQALRDQLAQRAQIEKGSAA